MSAPVQPVIRRLDDRRTAVAIDRILEFDVDSPGAESKLSQLASDDEHVALELRKMQQRSNDRKTVAVCRRLLPTGDQDTVVRVVDESVTVGELNAWCDRICSGDAVCMRFEMVDQWQG